MMDGPPARRPVLRDLIWRARSTIIGSKPAPAAQTIAPMVTPARLKVVWHTVWLYPRCHGSRLVSHPREPHARPDAVGNRGGKSGSATPLLGRDCGLLQNGLLARAEPGSNNALNPSARERLVGTGFQNAKNPAQTGRGLIRQASFQSLRGSRSIAFARCCTRSSISRSA